MNIDADKMLSSAREAETVLKALANCHRLMILCRLGDGECSVGELAQALDLRDSTVSQHLALLRKDGLVAARREAQTVWYSIASAPAKALIETLYRIYCAPDRLCDAGKKRR
jgi:ArsR family transcriptional regulator, virulence genes transcriptional regulator